MDIWQTLTFGFSSGKRILDTTFVASKNSVEYLIGSVLGQENMAPKQLRKSFTELGATYIKLGQLIASAPSLFPKEYVTEFQQCLDQVAPIPFDQIKKIIEKELQHPIEKLFRHVDVQPLASASIAQVHAATMHTGAEVVLKVQRPDVQDKLNVDMNFLAIAAHILQKIAPEFERTSLTGIVEDFHKVMLEEVDFLLEAKNMETFDHFLQNIGEKKAMVPWVYWDYTTKRVLTMERLYGVALTDLDAIRAITNKPEEVLLTALNVWYQSLAFCEFFHADVHAGNLLALEDGRVAFIDFGIVGRISEEIWAGMLMLMQAMTLKDYYSMAKALAQTGATKEKVDIELFAKDIEKIFAVLDVENPEQLLHLSEMEMNGIVMKIAQVGENHGIRFPRAFALLMKQMLYFDRYVHILAPQMDILHDQRIQMPQIKKLKK